MKTPINKEEEIMELTGKLKEEVAKCETREEAKDKIKEAGVILNDQELDSVAGGYRNSTVDRLLKAGGLNPEYDSRRR